NKHILLLKIHHLIYYLSYNSFPLSLLITLIIASSALLVTSFSDKFALILTIGYPSCGINFLYFLSKSINPSFFSYGARSFPVLLFILLNATSISTSK